MSLDADASAAYHRFRQMARSLGTISFSFDVLTVGMSAAYLAALTNSQPAAWTVLVTRTALLVEHLKSFDGVIELDPKEREAFDFFTSIVRENGDLLDPCEALGDIELHQVSVYQFV